MVSGGNVTIHEGANRLKLTSSAEISQDKKCRFAQRNVVAGGIRVVGVEGSERCEMRLHSLPQRRIPDGQPVCGERVKGIKARLGAYQERNHH